MKRIEWVTGMQGAGKTTYIGRLLHTMREARFGGEVSALYVGKICREKFGASNMAKDPNAAAPEYTESFVRQLVVDAVNAMGNRDVLIIDGMPRKPSQVQWVKEQFEVPTIKNSLTYLMCQDEVRKERAARRDQGNEGNLALNAARSEQESAVFRRVLEEAIFCNLSITVIDTSPESMIDGWQDLKEPAAIEAVKYYDLSLGTMFTRHTEFANMVMGRMGTSMEELFKETHGKDVLPQMHQSVEWARKFVQKAQGELAELLRELPDNWWSKDSVDLRAARVELIDAWHFLISASMALGMGPIDFSTTFYGKLGVNFDRQRGGYSKKDKVGHDDVHVGKQDSDVLGSVDGRDIRSGL